MKNSIDLLSKEFISRESLMTSFERITQKLHLNLYTYADSISIVNQDVSVTLDIHFLTELKFNELKDEEVFLPRYGNFCYFMIYYSNNDTTTVPVLKELLYEYPDIVVYKDERMPKAVSFYSYSKYDFDGYEGADFETFFDTKPKGFENLT